eukprot:6890035-Prymnesium_polylepis.1
MLNFSRALHPDQKPGLDDPRSVLEFCHGEEIAVPSRLSALVLGLPAARVCHTAYMSPIAP